MTVATAGHPLDRPIWSALTTRQASFALGDGLALRYAPDYAVFAAAAEETPEHLAALAALIPSDGAIACIEALELAPPPGTIVKQRAVCHQLVADFVAAGDHPFEITPLTEDDAAEMLALATLTQPGPFFARTHQLGDFLGVKRGGSLLAMAGERLKLPGFTEVSAVCTHPDHRGRGYANGLIRQVASRIQAQGETPFLHAFAHNTGALTLYRALGFSLRREMALTVLARPNAP